MRHALNLQTMVLQKQHGDVKATQCTTLGVLYLANCKKRCTLYRDPQKVKGGHAPGLIPLSPTPPQSAFLPSLLTLLHPHLNTRPFRPSPPRTRALFLPAQLSQRLT